MKLVIREEKWKIWVLGVARGEILCEEVVRVWVDDCMAGALTD